MTQPPKEKAKELITHYHNLIQDIGGELGQENPCIYPGKALRSVCGKHVIKR